MIAVAALQAVAKRGAVDPRQNEKPFRVFTRVGGYVDIDNPLTFTGRDLAVVGADGATRAED